MTTAILMSKNKNKYIDTEGKEYHLRTVKCYGKFENLSYNIWKCSVCGEVRLIGKTGKSKENKGDK